MSKLEDWKEAIKNTPPQRLAKIEYQSHFLQMFGVTFACIVLLTKGFWYIIFAFIFSLGISYSQGVGAYQKYKAIVSIVGKEEVNPKTEKSPSRRRSYIIRSAVPVWFNWLLILGITLIHYLFFPYSLWWQKPLFGISIIIWYVAIYFFPLYWIAKLLKRDDGIQ